MRLSVLIVSFDCLFHLLLFSAGHADLKDNCLVPIILSVVLGIVLLVVAPLNIYQECFKSRNKESTRNGNVASFSVYDFVKIIFLSVTSRGPQSSFIGLHIFQNL